jgi:capsule polysaccharide export protein KpsE/RkpR
MLKKPHSAGTENPMEDAVVLVRHDNELAVVTEQVDRFQVRKRNVAKLRLILSQRVFLCRFVALGLIASLLMAFSLSNRYTSTTRLMPPDNDSGAGLATVAAALSGASGIGAMATSLLGEKSNSDIFVGVLSSRTTHDELIQEFDLKKVYGVRRIEDARQELANRTSISIDRKSQIITIEVIDKDPHRAAAIAAAYVGELNRLVTSLSTSSARRERIFLEGRLRDVRADLETAEKNFSQFASKNTAIDITEQGKAMVGAAATLEGELIGSRSELEGLKQIYSDNNVRVRSLTARVAELQSQMEKLVGKGDVDAAPGQDYMYPSIRRLPLLGVSYADLFRQTKVQEAVFETLTKEYELAKVQEAKEIPTVKVLDPADVPEKKSYPPRALIVFFGVLLSACAALAAIFVSANWKSIDPNDPGKILAREIFNRFQEEGTNGSPNGSVSRQIAERIQKGLGWRNGSYERQR